MEHSGINIISLKDIEYKEMISSAESQNKVYRAILTSSDGSIHRVVVKNSGKVKEEVEILAALKHKNIIKFYGVVKLDFPPDGYVVVTKYEKKGSLSNVIAQNRENWSKYKKPIWKKWAREGALALQFIHKKGYQHGDVKHYWDTLDNMCH